MSMHPHAIAAIPEETGRVARAAFPHGNISLTVPLYYKERIEYPHQKHRLRMPLFSNLTIIHMYQSDVAKQRKKLSDKEEFANTCLQAQAWQSASNAPSPSCLFHVYKRQVFKHGEEAGVECGTFLSLLATG